MSVRSVVESDKMLALRAYQDTRGMSDPERSVFWLERLAHDSFRGRGDTITAARDRAAKKCGAPISKAKRLWDRWQTMKTVAGDVMIPLMLAYEDLCERNEAAAREYRDERQELREKRNAACLEHARQGLGTDGARRREMAR